MRERWIIDVLDIAYIGKIFGRLVSRVPYTVSISFFSIIFSWLIAILLTAVRVKKVPIINQVIEVYISFFRSTPGLIHILLLYYGLPLLLAPLGIHLNANGKSFYAVASLSLSNAAFLSEILRPAYLSIDRGQHEAALSIGLSGLQKEVRIILPQIIPIALPAMANSFIELIKDTSILFVIGMADIMGEAKNILSNNYGTKKTEIYLAVGMIYLAMTTVGNLLCNRVEIQCQHVRKKTKKIIGKADEGGQYEIGN
jgi:L-cystine transport system permease protein